MDDSDLQAIAAGLAYDNWDPVTEFGPGRAIETYEHAQAAAFLAGHAAGWRDRENRDAEPERGAVVRAVFPDSADAAGRVFQRRDDWTGGLEGSLRRWFPIMPRDTHANAWPMSWAELLLSGAEITELVEGGAAWPAMRVE